jgi:hypothetical protein
LVAHQMALSLARQTRHFLCSLHSTPFDLALFITCSGA